MSISAKALPKLRELFLDEFITIYLKDMNVVTVSEEGSEMKISAMTDGYCIDIDCDFFYLGLSDGTITRTVNHEIAQMVELNIEVDVFLSGPSPERDEDWN